VAKKSKSVVVCEIWPATAWFDYLEHTVLAKLFLQFAAQSDNQEKFNKSLGIS